MSQILYIHGLEYHIEIRARFGTTVLGLIQQNLGVAVLDCFTVDDLETGGSDLKVISIGEKATFSAWIARRGDIDTSSFSHIYIDIVRQEMASASKPKLQ